MTNIHPLHPDITNPDHKVITDFLNFMNVLAGMIDLMESMNRIQNVHDLLVAYKYIARVGNSYAGDVKRARRG